MTTFEAVIQETAGAKVVRLAGDAGMVGVEPLQAYLARLAERRPGLVILDLTGVSLLGSAAMGALLEFRSALQRHGGMVWVVAPPGPVQESLCRAGLDEVVEMYDSVEEALA